MKINFKDFTSYFLIIVIIFSTDTFIVYANTNQIIKYLFQVLIFLGIICLSILLNNGISISKKKTLSFILMELFIFLCAIRNADFSGGVLIKILILTFGFLYSCVFGFKEFCNKFVTIVLVVAIASLIIYFFSPLISKMTFLPIISNGKLKLICLGLSNIPIDSSSPIRNWGPFWEPGVFQVYLLLSFSFLIYLKDRNVYKKIILIVAVLTTFSTSGYIGLFIIFMILYIDSEWSSNVHNGVISKIIISVLVFSIIYLILSNREISNLIFGKFNKSSYSFVSTMSRVDSISINFDILKTSPFFGVGPTELSAVYNKYLFLYGSVSDSNTNGLMMNFSIFGLFFGSLYTYLLVKFSLGVFEKNILRFLFVMLIMLMLFSEPLINSLVFNCIIFFCYEMRCKNELSSSG